MQQMFFAHERLPRECLEICVISVIGEKIEMTHDCHLLGKGTTN